MGILAKLRRAVRHTTNKERSGQQDSKEKMKIPAQEKVPKAVKTKKKTKEMAAVSSIGRKTEGGSVENFSAQSTKTPVTCGSVEKLFSAYCDANEDSILAEGMEKLCIDMHIDPTDVRMLALAWKFGAATMCRFSRKEFVSGCLALSVDNADALREKLDSVLEESSSSCSDLYKFTFRFGLEAGERCASKDMAIALWQLVLPVCGERVNTFTEEWCRFLEEKDIRGVTRDCWMVYFEFCQVVDEDLSNYSFDDAWPSLLDEFVEAQRKKRGLIVKDDADNNDSDDERD